MLKNEALDEFFNIYFRCLYAGKNTLDVIIIAASQINLDLARNLKRNSSFCAHTDFGDLTYL